MTSFYDFQPNRQGPFIFQPTLDGQIYNAQVVWSVFGRRYYLYVYSLGGDLIFSVPMVGSPAGLALAALSWSANVVTAKTLSRHGFTIGQTARVTIAGVTPDAYNGVQEILITGLDSFTYPLTGNPGGDVILGAIYQNADLAGGYFDSTIVYRQPSNQFEVSP